MDRMGQLAQAYARKRRIPNPVDYVDGAALGRHLRGGVTFPKVGPQNIPTQMIADPRRKRGASAYDKGSGRAG